MTDRPDRSDEVIDRRDLVTRHDVTLTEPDPLAPLSVGNGNFAFTADVTGLQTFPAFYDDDGDGMPLHTQSHWGWHRMANEHGYELEDTLVNYEVNGREVSYASETDTPAGEWLRANPHRLDLGRIGLVLETADGDEASIDELSGIEQTLCLWSGRLESQFTLDDESVSVETVAHPDEDAVAARIESPLLTAERLGVRLAFPYALPEWRGTADWSSPERHRTEIDRGREDDLATDGDRVVTFDRTLDDTNYSVALSHSAGTVQPAAESNEDDPHAHEYRLFAPDTDAIEFVVRFSERNSDVTTSLPGFEATREAATDHWQQFWERGGAINLSESEDPRWEELERRIVLSQYQTAINCAGSLPPQETGLVTNSWFGKFHLEMHWWHAVHFAFWNRFDLLDRSLGYYEAIADCSREKAQRQGYDGLRWPKMTDPEGRESPSGVGVFLIWQQPHPIYYAELAYREQGAEALERYDDLVFETAAFMADYPVWDDDGDRYVLGPVLIPAQESYGTMKERVRNPTFELVYWHWGLQTAQRWRERLGMDRDEEWDHVLEHLSEPPIDDGVYAGIESEPGTIYEDHPNMLAGLGMMPETPLIDPETMDRTLDHITERWDWDTAWGWDFPTMAMTAARLGRGDDAIDALLLDEQKNTYLANGHNYQEARLPLYLPGNGGLLTAAAMMAAGWEDALDEHAPGFPDEGWTVRYENLDPMP